MKIGELLGIGEGPKESESAPPHLPEPLVLPGQLENLAPAPDDGGLVDFIAPDPEPLDSEVASITPTIILDGSVSLATEAEIESDGLHDQAMLDQEHSATVKLIYELEAASRGQGLDPDRALLSRAAVHLRGLTGLGQFDVVMPDGSVAYPDTGSFPIPAPGPDGDSSRP